MGRVFRKNFLLSFVIFLAACATTAAFEEQVNSWVGKSDSDLIASYGEPDKVIKLPNGDKAYQYNYSRVVQRAAQWSSSGNYGGGSSTSFGKNSVYGSNSSSSSSSSSYMPATQETLQCVVRYTIHAHTIVNASYSGNDCRAVSKDLKGLHDLFMQR